MSTKLFTIKTNRSNVTPIYNIKDLVFNILKNVVPNPELYVDNKYIKIWIKAFTSETYDPTFNYEDEEYVGDRVLKVVYPKYLSIRYPTYNRKELSNIDMLVMEKKNQYDLAFELGLIDQILIPHRNTIPVGVGGDVFESFFGALDTVGDLVEKGTGIVLCFNLITYIFNQNTIPDNLKLGSSKMIVEQIFKRLTLPPIKVVIYKQNQLINVKLELNKEQLDYFNSRGVVLTPIISEAYGKSQKPTIIKAYDNAYQYLLSQKIDEQFITVKDKKVEEKVEKVYDRPIKDIVNDILTPIIKQKNVLERIVNNTLWNKVFYEQDEELIYFGELLIKGLVAKWLTVLYPTYNKEDFNNIMSNISKNYSLFLDENIKDETILKMLLGALEKISHEILYGSGFINSYELIKLIFTRDKIPNEFRYAHPKTRAEQLLAPLLGINDSKFDVSIEYKDESFTVIIKLTDKQLNRLQQYFNIKDQLLAVVEGKAKKETEREAYRIAIEKLETYGINKERVNTIQNEEMFTKLPYYNEIKEQKLKDGYDMLYFASPTKTFTKTHYTLQLVGVKNDKKVILSHLIVEDDQDREAKIQLIRNYLRLL